MKVIGILNEKGGVGKTTLATTLACGLAAKNKKVVLVDTGEQGHVSVALGRAKEPGFFELMQRNRPWAEVLRPIPAEKFMPPGTRLRDGGMLHIVPSDIETRALPLIMRPEGMQLRKRIEQLADVVDYVVIDTDPAAGLLHLLIYTAVDYMIYPTKVEELSFDGLLEALAHMESANFMRGGHHLPPVEVMGIVPTMYRSNSIEHKTNRKALENHYGHLVWEPIVERTLWAEALAGASNYTPVYAHAPGTPAAKDAWTFINHVIESVEGVQVGQPA